MTENEIPAISVPSLLSNKWRVQSEWGQSRFHSMVMGSSSHCTCVRVGMGFFFPGIEDWTHSLTIARQVPVPLSYTPSPVTAQSLCFGSHPIKALMCAEKGEPRQCPPSQWQWPQLSPPKLARRCFLGVHRQLARLYIMCVTSFPLTAALWVPHGDHLYYNAAVRLGQGDCGRI